MIKQLFTDMDGTLLNPQGELSPATIQAIKQAHLPLTLVSARAAADMLRFVEALGLTGPQIGFNGALIYQVNHHQIESRSEIPLSKTNGLKIIQAVQKHFPEVSINFYDATHWFAPKHDHGVDLQAERSDFAPQFGNPTDILANHPQQLLKITLLVTGQTDPQAVADLITNLNFPNISLQLPAAENGITFIDITNAQAQKSRGVQYVLDQAGITNAEAAAFGDGENDLPMLEMVGLPIAMGNASDKVKAVAKYVTKANSADGWAAALTHQPALVAASQA